MQPQEEFLPPSLRRSDKTDGELYKDALHIMSRLMFLPEDYDGPAKTILLDELAAITTEVSIRRVSRVSAQHEQALERIFGPRGERT